MNSFDALADPTRRRIVEMLSRQGQLSATEIARHFDMSAPAISQHLKVLREANVVEMEKRAQQRLYRINPETLTAMESWVHELKRRWEERFEALDKILEQEKANQEVGRAVKTAATGTQSVPADTESKDKTPKGQNSRRKKHGKQE